MSEQPAGPPNPEQQSEINDPPIEYDPIGQALVGLPVAIATGIGSAAMEGADLVGEVGKEVISWGAAELGIGAAEHAAEGPDGAGGAGTSGAEGSSSTDTGGSSSGADSSGSDDSSDAGAGDYPYDPSADAGAG